MLLNQKQDLEGINQSLSYKLARKCIHNKESGYYFPFPKICFECAVDYYKYCKKNLIKIDEVFFKDVAIYVQKEEAQKEQEEILRQEELRKKREIVKKTKREEQLLDYQNTRNLTATEAGYRYERYIGYLLETSGFRVDYNGILKGVEDRGIDLIATHKKIAYVIQCKRYAKTKDVHEKTISQLIGSYSSFKRRNVNKYTEVKPILYTSFDNLDAHARETLGLHPEIQHIVEPHKEDYPMIKCNIGNNGEKIYHIPNDAMYDLIKIELNKGEFYCYTEAEAEAKGFRRSER